MQVADTAVRTLIVGLGKTGLSVARYLAARGDAVAVTDSRDEPPGLAALSAELPDTAVFLGGFSEDALGRADQVVVSPGVATDIPFIHRAREKGLPILGDIELFARAVDAPVVAVTGSNGKSTVATLVGLMAERAGRVTRTGGNLGTPALELLGADEKVDLYVLELSSFQLELTDSLHCAAAVVLNISADHMDRYPDIAAYAAAKARIYERCEVAIANRQDPLVMVMVAGRDAVTTFGLDAPKRGEYGLIKHEGSQWLARGDERLLAMSALPIRGTHNAANALAALALGAAVGLSIEAMVAVLREFRGLPHRMQWVGEAGDVVYVNDSKATNVGAALAAMRGLEMPLVVIAGGDGKGADFAPFADALAGRARALVLIGRDAARIEEAVAGRTPVYREVSIEAAVRRSHELAQPGDMVLLSPACSSLDMFEDFAARGTAFVNAVREVAHV